MAANPIFTFAHIGDLHLTIATAENARDFTAIISQLNEISGLDFVYLPGDNADNGKPEQYALLRRELDRLLPPVHIITGDHDMETGSLEAYYSGLAARKLPYAVVAGGVRCLFLDMCGPGTGGSDFHLGREQVEWLASQIANAKADGQDCSVFMHSYPADLKGEGEAARVADLIHQGPVRLVEIGHTHYNELANDGRTIYAATRSTGQIEEGAVGYAIAALDDGRVSWRFKELARPWPFVLITSPTDYRLAHDLSQVVSGEIEIRALVLGNNSIAACEHSIDGAAWQPMRPQGSTHRFAASAVWPENARTLAVRALDDAGHRDSETIEPAGQEFKLQTSKGIGSDADTVGAWPEKGLLGTQLGPNRNGKTW